MAHMSISIPDDTLEDFDKVLTVMSARGELDTDRRSPLVSKWVREYVAENQDYVELYDEVFTEGNRRAGPAAVTAD